MNRRNFLLGLGGSISCLGLISCTVSDLNKAPSSDLAPLNQPLIDTLGSNSRTSALGAAQHPRILSLYGGEYNDTKLERMVAKIVGKLTGVADTSDETYRITILNSPSINAFALPGGYVYVTRGLLALANDSSEVAAVIAHEMAHIIANHGILRQEKQAQMEITSAVVGQILGDKLAEKQVEMRSHLSLAQFSRNQELQADAIGIKMVAAAGYDPFAAARFLLRMEAYTSFRSVSGATNARLDFLATHPATPQRVKLAMAEARRVSAPGIGATDREAFLAGIDGMIYGDSDKEGYIRGRNFIHPRLGIAFRVPQGFLLDNSKEAVMAHGGGDFAIRFDNVPLPPATLSALDYIRSGWVTGLESGSIRTFEKEGLTIATARAKSDKWQFAIVVILIKKQAYRFLIAAPKADSKNNEEALKQVSEQMINSFRLLSSAEIARIKPLRLRIVRVGHDESVTSIAAPMRDIDENAALFRLLNGLTPTSRLIEGTEMKLISE